MHTAWLYEYIWLVCTYFRSEQGISSFKKKKRESIVKYVSKCLVSKIMLKYVTIIWGFHLPYLGKASNDNLGLIQYKYAASLAWEFI